MANKPEFQKRLQSIEALLGRIDAEGNPALKADVRELIRLVMDLHGGGLERIIELAGELAGAEDIISRLGRDELAGSLLILYGIHPQTFEARVNQALDKARSRLLPHEAEVELLSMEDGAVRVRLRADGHGCGSTAQTLKQIIEDNICRWAPDISSLTIEDVEEKAKAKREGFVPLEMIRGMSPALVLTVAEKA